MSTGPHQKPPPGLIFIDDFTGDDGTVTPGIASRLGISSSTYRKWRMAGKGPESFLLGKKVVAREDAVATYLAGLEKAAQDARSAENPECRAPEPRAA